MNESVARKLWLTLCIIQFALVLALMSQLQGGFLTLKLNVPVGVLMDKDTPPAIVAMWGIILCGILSIPIAWLTREHARAIGTSWMERYPYRLMDIEPASGAGPSIQVAALTLFSVVPLYAIAHFWHTLIRVGTLCLSKEQPSDGSIFWFPRNWTIHIPWNHDYQLANLGVCIHSTTFEPFFQPLLMGLLTIFISWQMFRAGVAVFKNQSTKPKN